MTLFNAVVGSGDTTLLTVPSGQNYANVFMIFCNTSTVNSETITINVRPNGAGATDQNTIVKTLVIEATDSFEFDVEKLLLGQNDIISAKGTTGGLVSVTGSYITI